MPTPSSCSDIPLSTPTRHVACQLLFKKRSTTWRRCYRHIRVEKAMCKWLACWGKSGVAAITTFEKERLWETLTLFSQWARLTPHNEQRSFTPNCARVSMKTLWNADFCVLSHKKIQVPLHLNFSHTLQWCYTAKQNFKHRRTCFLFIKKWFSLRFAHRSSDVHDMCQWLSHQFKISQKGYTISTKGAELSRIKL